MKDREEIVSAFKQCGLPGACLKCQYGTEREGCYAALKHDVLELLKEQPAKDTNVLGKWISVKDRLPDDASDVLAYYDDSTESRIIPANYYKGCWYDCVFNHPIEGLETGFIKYWMSLPKAPEGGKPNENTL